MALHMSGFAQQQAEDARRRAAIAAQAPPPDHGREDAPVVETEAPDATKEIPQQHPSTRTGQTNSIPVVPTDLRHHKAWVLWKFERDSDKDKPRKVPYYIDGRRRSGVQGCGADRSALATYDRAATQFQRGGYAGIGLAILPEWGLVALDFDKVVVDGQIQQDVQNLIDTTYSEFSPSGAGVRAFFLGTVPANRKDNSPTAPFQVEFFSSKGFVTVTGEKTGLCKMLGLDDTIAPITQDVLDLYQERFGSASHSEGPTAVPVLDVEAAKAKEMLDLINPDPSHDVWFRIGLGLHHQFGADGFELWNEWSARGAKYPGEKVLRQRWRSIRNDDTNPVTISTVKKYAREAGWREDLPFDVLPIGEEEKGLRTVQPPAGALDAVGAALMQHPTQDNVALIFRRNMEGKFLYAHSLASWYEWDGTRWRREGTKKASNFVRNIARTVNSAGKASISSANFCAGVETFCRADPAFSRVGSEFDRNNYLLNTPAGVFDLRQNILREHNPDDLITLITSVGPVSAGGDRFIAFMEEITGGDKELIEFHQVTLGACLSGAIESHWLLFWTGAGRNGKNTLGDLVMFILNDYARKIPSSTLMAKAHEGHPTEIATLRGIRLATASEVGDGDHWHESRINEFTGDATLTARFMGGNFFDFPRTHKHLVYGNHRPQLRSITEAIKARVKIVPFKQSFIGREDPELPAKLQAEAGFVLHWLLEGHAKWMAAGRKLPNCAAVEAESEDYFDSQSTIESWIAERIIRLDEDNRKTEDLPKSSTLYTDYAQWKRNRGEGPVSQTRWGDTMSKLFQKVKANGFRYRHVELRPYLDAIADDCSDLV